MSDDITKNPLPANFYKRDGWHKNIVEFYSEEQKRLPKDCLREPIKLFTQSMDDIIKIYGNFPEIVYKAIGQAINPTFEEQEYLDKIYNVLVDAGKKEDRPMLIRYADGLLNIRKLFTGDKNFMKDKYAKEIELVAAPLPDLNFDKFRHQIGSIVRIHVNQIRRFIYEIDKD